MWVRSGSRRCARGSSTSTGRNVPGPTSSVMRRDLVTRAGERGEQRRGEVQPRRRRRHRARAGGVDGLIAQAIVDGGRRVPEALARRFDVRRQRQLADAVEHGQQRRPRPDQTQQRAPRLAPLDDLDRRRRRRRRWARPAPSRRGRASAPPRVHGIRCSVAPRRPGRWTRAASAKIRPRRRSVFARAAGPRGPGRRSGRAATGAEARPKCPGIAGACAYCRGDP